jgi:ATP-dependent DNA ligase
MPLSAPPPAPSLDALSLMERSRGAQPFSHAAWSFELPTPGYRMLAEFGTGRSRLVSSHHVDVTRWFPEVSQALGSLQVPRTVVDGDICVLDASGRSDLRLLHLRALRPGWRPGTSAVVLCVSDLLVCEGRDVRTLPWWERRLMLRTLPLEDQPLLRLQRALRSEGEWMYRQALALGRSALHAWRREAPYQAGRCADWLAIPCPST